MTERDRSHVFAVLQRLNIKAKTKQVNERLVSTLENTPVPKWDMTNTFDNEALFSKRFINWFEVLSMEGVTSYGHPPEFDVAFWRGVEMSHVARSAAIDFLLRTV